MWHHTEDMSDMGFDVTSPVFRVSNKGILKPVSSSTETSKKVDIWFVTSLDMILYKKWITKALISLYGCESWSVPLLFTNPPKTGFLASRPISSTLYVRRVFTDLIQKVQTKTKNPKYIAVYAHLTEWQRIKYWCDLSTIFSKTCSDLRWQCIPLHVE